MKLALAILLLAGGIGLLFWDTGVLQDPAGAWNKACGWFEKRPVESTGESAPAKPVVQGQSLEMKIVGQQP